MIDFTIKKQEHIDHIIDRFDFAKIHNVMKFLKWEWYMLDNNGQLFKNIPSIDDLKKEAISLLNSVYDSDSSYVSTGGLKAIKCDDHLELEFMLDDSSSELVNYGEDYEKRKKLKVRKKKINKIENLTENENN